MSADLYREKQIASIFNTPFHLLSYEQVLKQLNLLRQKKSTSGSTVYLSNAHSLYESSRSSEFAKICLAADLNLLDGRPLVWFLRILGFKEATQIYGPTLFNKIISRAEQEKWRLAFFGSRPEILELLRQQITKSHPNLLEPCYISPPFSESSHLLLSAEFEKLKEYKPEIVLISLGCPKQERFAHAAALVLPTTFVTVGAAFDFYAGSVLQCPSWIRFIGMEWCFRLLVEPRRLASRYFKVVPYFLFRGLKELFVNKTRRL